MNYYRCINCDYISKQKIDIIRHLNKKIKCNNKTSNNLANDLDLIRHNIFNDLGLKINVKDNSFSCNNCKKKFHNKSNLNRHIHSDLKCNLDEIEIENKYSVIVGFENDWITDHITYDIKMQLLLSESKFTNTLKCILNNEKNLNVILKDNGIGIVYKNKSKQYEAMSIKEIIKITMEKIYNILCLFFNELINENEIEEDIINLIKNKYNIYKKNMIIRNEVNICLINIYEENKIKSLKKIMEFIK
jgi:hypothetical protein